LYAQKEELISLETNSGKLEGTLLIPITNNKIPLALLISGSGPTDRDGNNPMMKNNSLKMLAEELAKRDIATLRYDKRGVGKSKIAGIKEVDLRFENYIDDAKSWLELIDKDNRFDKIIVIGHSEGSLIGMIAAQQKNVTKFISVAGVGQPAADILRKQLAQQPPIVLEMSEPILEKLEHEETTEDVPPGLYSLFRPSVQPYMISWFRYNPKKEIGKLKIPILIIQGTTDIQSSVSDAEQLLEGNPIAKKVIIDGMNHILKESELDRQKNIETYSNPDLPLAKGLVEIITEFIKQ
jgi:pimeloyl-ACP methyl ester carboxylesterase